MIRALQLILVPASTWQKIAQSKPSVVRTILFYLLPLMILGGIAEGFGLEHYGERRGDFNHLTTYTRQQVLIFEGVQIAAGLLVIAAGAWIVRSFSVSFHLQLRYTNCFTLAAYGLSPIYLVRLLEAVPIVGLWLYLCLGMVFAVFILYQGVGFILEPQPTQGMGLYLMCVLGLGLLSGLAHLLALALLHERI
jgi:hypothetical protein